MEQKVYAILYNAYEFDDLSYGDLTPKFMSLSKDTVLKEFESIKEKEINWFNNILSGKEEWLKEHPERKEDYQICTNTEDSLEIYVGNWCYEWRLTEYELDKYIKQ